MEKYPDFLPVSRKNRIILGGIFFFLFPLDSAGEMAYQNLSPLMIPHPFTERTRSP
jgi:hypothetical protein